MYSKIFYKMVKCSEPSFFQTVDALADFKVGVSVRFGNELRIFVEDFLRDQRSMDTQVLIIT